MATDSVDLAVIGAGPAGLSAAATAAGLGLSVALFDEQPAPGGQVWRNQEIRRDDRRGLDLIARVRTAPGVRLRPSTTVFDIGFESADGPVLTWMTGGSLGRTAARAVILATGAMERALPFPGWTLPGVLGVGALQTALKSGGLVPDPDAGLVVAGHGPLVLLALAQIAAAGGRVAAVLDIGKGGLAAAARHLPVALLADPLTVGRGIALLARRALSGVPVHRGVRSVAALGDGRVEAVRYTDASGEHTLPCRLLAVHDGVIPNTQITRLIRLDHEWRPASKCFAPATDICGRASRPGVWVAGDGAGIEGAKGAETSGTLAALDVARSLGRLSDEAFRSQAAGPMRQRQANRRLRRFLDALDPPLDPTDGLADDTVVCRCEEVTAGTIRSVIASGSAGPNRVKTATRCGMGACQGRMCGPVLTRIVACETSRSESEVGALRIRPPLKPVPMAAIAGFEASDEPEVPE